MVSVIRTARARGVPLWCAAALAASAAVAMVIMVGAVGVPVGWTAPTAVGLGAAEPFAVLANSTITNTGPTRIKGSIGVNEGSAITGFPPGTVTDGTQHSSDAAAGQAKASLTQAYTVAAGLPQDFEVAAGVLVGPLLEGVYHASSGMSLPGELILSGDASSVFIFQADSTLVTATDSVIRLVGGVQPCHVFWVVGSSATLGTRTRFVGTIMAMASVTAVTGTSVAGRLLARTGAVTVDTTSVRRPVCAAAPGGGSSASPTGTASAGPTGTATTVPTAAGTGAPGGPTSTAEVPGGRGGPIIPNGRPQTGAGGAAGSGNGTLVVIGAVALVGAGAATVQAIRRRRARSTPGLP
ncbi:MAG: hypothetical protein QOI74_91 [Micromonosporaceae bacterium]|jgi:type VI secretion system secreted protein VgrG|nr:hypothetical protein [Micromonosporaceae bacterium]MDT5038979.1 hypothetical protein [Micromonosporaceae bacterium]